MESHEDDGGLEHMVYRERGVWGEGGGCWFLEPSEEQVKQHPTPRAQSQTLFRGIQ